MRASRSRVTYKLLLRIDKGYQISEADKQMLSSVKSLEFKSFIDDYRGHIAEYSPESYSCIGEPEEVSFDGEFLRCMKMQYEVGRIYFAIYHIIVRMGQ